MSIIAGEVSITESGGTTVSTVEVFNGIVLDQRQVVCVGGPNSGDLLNIASVQAGVPVGTELGMLTYGHTYCHPLNVLGCYSVNGRTPTYSGLGASSPLFSMRWGSATQLCIVLRFSIFVVTTITAGTAGLTERELIIARGFTASDSGGTAITLTGNNQKRRTSQATSLMTDIRAGGPLTAGTRTLDANPIASAAGWSPTATVGVVIGSAGAVGGIAPVNLLDAVNGQEYPVVLAQNEGLILRIGKDSQPSSATQQTYFNLTWAEVSAY